MKLYFILIFNYKIIINLRFILILLNLFLEKEDRSTNLCSIVFCCAYLCSQYQFTSLKQHQLGSEECLTLASSS